MWIGRTTDPRGRILCWATDWHRLVFSETCKTFMVGGKVFKLCTMDDIKEQRKYNLTKIPTTLKISMSVKAKVGFTCST